MEEVLTQAFVKNYDPTRTTGLRNAFVSKMKSRFAELSYKIKYAIKVQDCFGLLKEPISVHQTTSPGYQAFNFPRNADKLEAFMKWLEEQVKRGILEVGTFKQIGTAVEKSWMDLYLFDSYKRGVMRAREELKKAGYNIPDLDRFGGIEAIMGTPFHIERMGLIFTRAFNDLKGITAEMDTIISRILAQGLADGDGPALLARKIVEAINSTGKDTFAISGTTGTRISSLRRAIILARTEIIRAHHLATIQEYRNWGVEGIVVKGEWKTAGDDRVCSKCAELEGRVYTLDEIENMIPYHPECRCIALPFIEELQKYK